MIFRNKTLILTIFMLISFQLVSLAQYISKDRQKADYVYRFPWYLLWENDMNLEEIKIGVFNGSDGFIKELKKVCKKNYPDGTKVSYTNIQNINDIPPTHVLYVEKDKNHLIPQIKERIRGRSTAIVTDEYNVRKDIMFNFITDKSEHVTFEFNRQTLRAVNISVHEFIKDLGGIDIDAEALYKDAEKDLNEATKRLKEQQAQLEKQRKEIEIQIKKIDEQRKEIELQKTQIDVQNRNILEQKNVLANLQGEIEKQKEELDRKILLMKMQEDTIKIQQFEVNKQKEILKTQNDQIAERQLEIEKQKKILEEQGFIIKVQQNLLYVFVGIGALILMLAIFIFRQYRIKRRDNIILAKQKSEIQRQANELEIINFELEKLSIVASETSNAVAILDQDGNFEWINAGFTRLYGYTLQLLHNELDENIKKASSYKKIEEIIQLCTESKKPQVYENMTFTRYGERKWSQTSLSPILNHDHQVVKFVLIDSDITKIKLAEEEIRQQKEEIQAQAEQLLEYSQELEKLSIVAQKTDNSVIIADANGDIEWVNEGFERLVGVKFDEFKSTYGNNLISSSLNPDILDVIEKGLYDHKSVVYTSKTVTKKGRLIWIQTTLTPIFDGFGNLSKLVAIDADITKIKIAEEEIAKQKQKIMDSIQYASRIQNAVLPPREFIENFMPEHFILFKPRDIVSGDFYWITKVENKIFMAVADCTGHGVPGAFMSMLGISFMNEIVGQGGVEITPELILNQLREKVKISLRQTGKEGEAKDGMDIALCSLNLENMELNYAGAHNPLIIVRRGEIIQFNADEMPIGIYYNEKESFTNYITSVQPNDMIYMFSDGYADQFGGSKGRKFMIKRFRQLLITISKESMEKQQEILNTEIEEWRGERIQLDDILVLGVRIKSV